MILYSALRSAAAMYSANIICCLHRSSYMSFTPN